MQNDSCVQSKTKLGDFVEITRESNKILPQGALQAIRELGLENKVTVISGDNTQTPILEDENGKEQCFLQNKRRSKQRCDWLRVCSTHDSQLGTFFY
jgi:hypothetical protein